MFEPRETSSAATAERRVHTDACLEASVEADRAWDAYLAVARALWPFDNTEARRVHSEAHQAYKDAQEACGCAVTK